MSDEAAEQPDEWAGPRALRWVQMWKALDRQLAPVSELLFTAAALQPGERVLDVGCGTGPTSRRAATLVGPEGAVIGVDISPEMLDAAAGVAPRPGSAPIEWVVADVGAWRPTIPPCDVVLSRFGVMFFDDPPTAFANMLRLTAPGGRLHVAVWADRSLSPLFELPLSIARDQLRRRGLPADVPPPDGGPFSFHGTVARRALEAAGWRDVTLRPETVRLPVGGGLPPAEAARASLGFGPVRLIVDELDDDRRREICDAIAATYEDHVGPQGHVLLDAAPVLISARRPA